MDVLLLEKDVDVELLELSYILEAIKRISCKSADGLGYHLVYFSSHTIINHLVELLTFFGVGAGDSIIRIYSSQFPFRVSGNIVRVVGNLDFIASGLLIAVCTDTAICCNPELWLIFLCLHPAPGFFPYRDECNVIFHCESP